MKPPTLLPDEPPRPQPIDPDAGPDADSPDYGGPRPVVRDWSHQDRAVEALMTAYETHTRATVELPTGAGKTKISARIVKAKLPAHGRALIIVPNLDLVAQTLGEYIQELGSGYAETVMAVCSGPYGHRLARLDAVADGLEVTTDPRLIAAILEHRRRALVVCTYQSLQVVRAAHALCGLGRWSIAVIDEAHRSAGDGGREWSLIVDDGQIPCDLRLYQTATRRIIDQGESESPVVSMDDESIFGPLAFRLGYREAVEANVLVDYRVVVPVITAEALESMLSAHAGQDLHIAVGGDRAVSPEMLAKAVGLLKALHQHGARRAIAFSRTVADAAALAQVLPDIVNLLPPQERPSSVEAMCVLGRHRPGYRRRVFDKLGSPDPGIVVVTNANVLREGVNITRADAVAFFDPKQSAEAIVQAVGRTLRGDDANLDKVALIVIPLVIGSEQSPDDALAGSGFARLWHVIRALAAQDDRLDEDLRRSAWHLAARRLGLPQGGGPVMLPEWLKIDAGDAGVELPEGFIEAVTVQMVKALDPRWDGEWLENAACLNAFKRQHGHLRIPSGHLWGDPPREGALWAIRQRRLRRANLLEQWKVEVLDALGFVWEPADASWRARTDLLTAYREVEGHLNITLRPREVWKGENIGNIYTHIRTAWRKGLLTKQQIAEAEAIDGFVWEPDEEAYRLRVEEFREFAAAHARLPQDSDAVYAAFRHYRTASHEGLLSKPRAQELAGIFGPQWMDTRVRRSDANADPIWRMIQNMAAELGAAREAMDPPVTRAALGHRLGINARRLGQFEEQIAAHPPRMPLFFRWIAAAGCTLALLGRGADQPFIITRAVEENEHGWFDLVTELRRLREHLGIARPEIADAAHTAPNTVGGWEQKIRLPSLYATMAYACTVGTPTLRRLDAPAGAPEPAGPALVSQQSPPVPQYPEMTRG